MPHDRSRPFDVEANDAADITTQFWGKTRGWEADPDAESAGESIWAERTGSLRAIRHNLTGNMRRTPARHQQGRIDRTRSHGIVRPTSPDVDDAETTAPARREATLGELAAGWVDDEPLAHQPLTRRHDWTLPTAELQRAPRRPRKVDVEVELQHERPRRPAPRRQSAVGALSERLGVGAVDPLLARLGAIVLIGAAMLPVALAARGGSEADLLSAPAAAVMAAPLAGAATADITATTVAAPPTVVAAEATTPTTAAASSTTASSTAAPETSATAPAATAAGISDAAAVTQAATRVEPECALTYEAAVGDSWYRIADGAGITPADLLAANLAQLGTPIFPGDEICLPPGAVMPPPPTTTAAPTTTPTTTVASAPPSTTAPTTTAAPATTAPLATTDQVQQLIREIWPDELEERALQIAWRESGYRANAYNGWCCYGVFQIYYTAHASWLDDFGVYKASDLFDARKNITAAYEIYQRAGGWGPWGG